MNIEPLKSFLKEEISPNDLAVVLNELLVDNVDLIVKLQLLASEVRPHVNTEIFILMLRLLRDLLNRCHIGSK